MSLCIFIKEVYRIHELWCLIWELLYQSSNINFNKIFNMNYVERKFVLLFAKYKFAK